MASDFSRKQNLADVLARLVETYHRLGKINHLGQCPLPNAAAVFECVDDLKEVMFPGYRRRQNLHFGNIGYHIGDLIDTLHDKLTEQVARALRHDFELRHRTSTDRVSAAHDFDAQAQEHVLTFLDSLPRVREAIATDVQAAFDGDPAAIGPHEIIFCYPGIEAITIQRLAHELHALNVPIIPRMMTEIAHARTGIDIHPGATIGPSFFIDHGTGVVIGETCEIGANVKLYQGVTLGALSFPKDSDGKIIRGRKRHPTIEDGVVIYANATILGGDTVIGAGSVIGATVSLSRSVPPNTIVTVEKPSLRFRDASPSQTG
jgi:serine O-acetyltransferase